MRHNKYINFFILYLKFYLKLNILLKKIEKLKYGDYILKALVTLINYYMFLLLSNKFLLISYLDQKIIINISISTNSI